MAGGNLTRPPIAADYPEKHCQTGKGERASGVSCIAFKAVGSGSLIGFADLHVAPFRLRLMGCAVFERDGRQWVTLPTRVQLDRDGSVMRDDGGKPKYYATVAFDEPTMQRRFSDAACAAIEAYRPGTFERR